MGISSSFIQLWLKKKSKKIGYLDTQTLIIILLIRCCLRWKPRLRKLVKALVSLLLLLKGKSRGQTRSRKLRDSGPAKCSWFPRLFPTCGTGKLGLGMAACITGCALQEATQFSGALQNFRGVGRRQVRSEDPGLYKWNYHWAGLTNPTVLGCQLPRKTESQHLVSVGICGALPTKPGNLGESNRAI